MGKLKNYLHVLATRFKQFKRKRKNIRLIKDNLNTLEIHEESLGKLQLDVCGKNNHIRIGKIHGGAKSYIQIKIYGDSNDIFIDDIFLSDYLSITMGMDHPYFGPIQYSKLNIGKDTSIGNMEYLTYNSKSECIIGSNCMFAFNIIFYNTDTHAILDYSTNKLVNFVKGIRIGNHCWIGKDVNILKNSCIPDDCIVGSNAVVSSSFTKEHAVYAGNPAKLIKENRTWYPNGKQYGYIDNIALKE